MAYDPKLYSETQETHVFAVLVDNAPGALVRVIGLFSGRGYNIESLTVAEVDPQRGRSRINIVSTGTPQVLAQIKAQLGRQVPVHRVANLTQSGPVVARDLALVKVKGSGELRVEALRIADIFGAKVIDSSLEHFVFELTGRASKIDRFVDLMRPLGLVELSRSGVAAMARGEGSITDTDAPH